MTVINASGLTLLRTRPHRTKLHLSLYVPRVVFAAQVNNADAAIGNQTIVYDNVTSGSYLNIVSGMTMYVGSSAGGHDKGRVRVRSAGSGSVLVAENWHIDWADNLYITVVQYYEPWAVFPRITLDANNFPTFYKDQDITYTDQNDILDPIPMMGPHLAALRVGSNATLYFDGSASYDLNSGGSIASWAWTFEGGSPASSSAATPGNVNWGAAGYYVVTLTVTNNLGRSYTARRHVSIYDQPGGTAPPVLNWGIERLDGDYGRGGWEGRFWMRQAAGLPQVVEGAQVVVFAEDWYGATKQSIGGNYPNRENVVFVGYVRDGSLQVDPETSLVSFAVSGLAERLDMMEGFSVSLESKVGATFWYEMKNMTVDRALQHYIRWHTTVYSVADVRKNGDTLPVQFADFPKESIRGALESFLGSTLFGHVVCDRQGQLWMEKKLDMVPLAIRAPGTAMTLARQDWREALEISQRREKPYSYVETCGIYYEGPGTGVFRALISIAPGNAPGYEGKTQIINGLVLESQAATNQLVGDVLYNLNNEFPEVRIPTAGNYRCFDIAPQERLKVTLSSAENFLGLSWIAKNTVPRGISFQYDRREQQLLVEVRAEVETDGVPGIPGPYPQEPPDTAPLPGPPPGDPDVPGGRVPAAMDQMFIATAAFLGGTKNFTASAPNWRNKGLGITGTIGGFALDPYSQKRVALVGTTTGLWKTNNLNLNYPAWVNILTAAQFLSATGKALSSVKNVRSTIAAQGVWFVQVMTSDTYVYVGITQDAGLTWTWRQVAQADATSDVLGFAASQHDANKCWSAGAIGRLYQSVNALGLFTFVNIYNDAGDTKPICNIEVPFDNNPTDQTIYIGGLGGGGLTTGTDTYTFDSDAQGWTYTPGIGSDAGNWQAAEGNPPGSLRARNTVGGFADPNFLIGINFKGGGSQTTGITHTVDGWLTATVVVSAPNDGKFIDSIFCQFRDGINNRGLWKKSYSPTPGNYQVKTGYVLSVNYEVEFSHYILWDNISIQWSTGAGGFAYIKKSTNGGNSFAEVSPSNDKGAVGWLGLFSHLGDANSLYALAGAAASSLDLDYSASAGAGWSVRQSGLSTPVSIYAWPYSVSKVAFLRSNRIDYSADGGVTLLNKTGDWATVFGAAFANPVQLHPVWLT